MAIKLAINLTLSIGEEEFTLLIFKCIIAMGFLVKEIYPLFLGVGIIMMEGYVLQKLFSDRNFLKTMLSIALPVMIQNFISSFLKYD